MNQDKKSAPQRMEEPQKHPAWNEAWDLTPEEARELDAFRAKPSRVQGQTFKRVPLQPPALPAEVEAVLAKLELQSVVPNQEMTLDEVRVTKQCLSEAATLLRRYAQAVAEKDAEIARLEADVDLRCCAACRKILREEH